MSGNKNHLGAFKRLRKFFYRKPFLKIVRLVIYLRGVSTAADRAIRCKSS
jgi:hypothetical protein